ncbi:hypothetical protein [Spirosoma montaniterrae]|uniref:Uncharacterized protein n=1 Tax=Spirosoma montaniterrae TaxID=1178516 RepID=A0A1P9WZ72_9BACT|nr:hypothetical protein [Spirosoma montaniterrae]AQG80644.1 hypothetical protein AWR27_15720 [Spirosoma montaniterrae]
MKHRIPSILLVVLAVLLVQWSCRSERDNLVQPVPPDLSIEEAKSWFTNQPSNARQAASKSNIIRNEYWSAAQKLNFTNGWPVVVVPLTYNYDHAMAFQNIKPGSAARLKKEDFEVQKKLLVYKDPKGNMLADVIVIIPTDDNRRKNKKVKGDDFDGYVLAYDRTETKYLGGWIYQNGKAKRREILKDNKGGRLAGTMGDCDILVYKNAGGQQAAKVGGGDTGGSGPVQGFYDGGGTYWQLDQVISADCAGGNNGTGNFPMPSPSTPSAGDPAWIWNLPVIGGGGLDGGNGNPSPTPIMIGDDGLIGASFVDRFFYDMEQNRGIFFSNEEKNIIRESFGYVWSDIVEYVDATGDKPMLIDGGPGPWDRFVNWLWDSFFFDTGDILPSSFVFYEHPQINTLQTAITTDVIVSLFDGQVGGGYRQFSFNVEVQLPKGQLSNGGYMTAQIAQRTAAVFLNLSIRKVQSSNAKRLQPLVDFDSQIKKGLLAQFRLLAKTRRLYGEAFIPPVTSGIPSHPAQFK